jgi:preprotein translocase subunit SecA
MFKFLNKLFDYNEKELNKLRRIVEQINLLENKARNLKDKDFSIETKKMKDQIASNEKKLDDLLPWAAALVREAARRMLGERHFDVQLMAGIALHQGKIVEQKTGEGKTLSATVPLYLNALEGKGVHLVTVNDYLARRDCGWMGKIFNFLGLTTAAIIADASFVYDENFINKEAKDWRLLHLRPITRKEAYMADITYGVNSEFGFDYLRDNMVQHKDEIVQRGFNYVIIDEADSVLIDEARTPHIISAPYQEDVSKYYLYARLVNKLEEKEDYLIDEKLRTAHLTEKGIEKIEKLLGTKNIYEKDYDAIYHIEAALKAKSLFKKNRDYIVKDNEVIIVDEFTGRLLYGRRFSEGLHQAIEAKENVPIKQESKTLATISLQNYFRMYKKLAGMTGTAATEAEEFNKIYHVDVVVIPTHRPMMRKDHPDLIYKKERAKFQAVVDEIIKNYQTGRPVLVGTTSIEKNEFLSQLLMRKGIPHQILNAKNHEKEASIIAQAGEKYAVTVATNMAGRGVDIILGGMPPNRYLIDIGENEYQNKLKEWQRKHEEIINLGGLLVIGTERHESRRIDNQLRGRAGRQGDPGESKFFISLEDDLMRIFGGEQISRLMTFFNFPEDQPLSHPMVSRAIEQAQIKVEGFNFDIRKHLVEFDDVLNKQREIIYKKRRRILFLADENSPDLDEEILSIFNEVIQVQLNNLFINNKILTREEKNLFLSQIKEIIDFDEKKIIPILENNEKLTEYLINLVQQEFEKRKKALTAHLWSQIIKTVYLSIIDRYWTDHLTAIEDLREGINLRGYAQLDPLVEYKNEAYRMFEELLNNINFDLARHLFRIEIINQMVQPDEKKLIYHEAKAIDPFTQAEKNTSSNVAHTQGSQMKKKLGRNDPCWCGSGKKYKKCHINREPQTAGEREAYNLYFNNPEEWEKRFGVKIKR